MTGGRSQCECVALRLDAVYLVLMHRQAITSSESVSDCVQRVRVRERGQLPLRCERRRLLSGFWTMVS